MTTPCNPSPPSLPAPSTALALAQPAPLAAGEDRVLGVVDRILHRSLPVVASAPGEAAA